MFRALNLDPDRYSDKAHNILAQIVQVDNYSTAQPLEAIIQDYDILILRFARKIDQALLSHAKRLKIIACNATGVDHIDVEVARGMNIDIISLKNEIEFLETIHATAELTWGLLLSVVRKIPAAHQKVLNRQWQRDDFLSSELYGKSIGILGLGRIGKKIAGYAEAFGMKVYAYDPHVRIYPGHVTATSSLFELAEVSDMLSIHVPYKPETHHLINHAVLQKCRKGACLINTSRGAVIDEVALLDALKSGHIAAVGADVLSNEHEYEFLDNNPLITYASTRENIVITPHIGGVTQDSWEKTEIFIANKIVSHLKSTDNNTRFGT